MFGAAPFASTPYAAGPQPGAATAEGAAADREGLPRFAWWVKLPPAKPPTRRFAHAGAAPLPAVVAAGDGAFRPRPLKRFYSQGPARVATIRTAGTAGIRPLAPLLQEDERLLLSLLDLRDLTLGIR